MHVKAVRNFLHSGNHVAAGAILEVDAATAIHLATIGRVVVTADENQTASATADADKQLPAPRRRARK